MSAALGGSVLALSACGTPAAPPIRTTNAPPAVTAAAATSAFPEKDTPLASAPADLRSVWEPYQVSIIPSRHIFDSMPPLPAVKNATGGVISDREATLIAAGEYRVNSIESWAYHKSQGALLDRLLPDPLRHGPDFQALAQGAAVDYPACQVYPTAITVHVVDGASRTFFAGRGEPVRSTVEFVISFPDCGATTATYPDGHTAEVYPASGATKIVVAGALAHDPVLGDIWAATAAAGCDQPGAPTEACAA